MDDRPLEIVSQSGGKISTGSQDYDIKIDQIHPSLLQIYKIVPAISSRWYDVGVMLFDYEHKIVLDLIRADHPNDMDVCCKAMFRRWLEVNPCASWNQLLKALDDLGLVTITNEIYKLLRTDMSFSSQNPVSRNEYHDAPPNRKVFKSKTDVTGNLGSLGQRQKVFIFYGPSAWPAGELESRVYNFARQLIIYGFEVVVDLFFNFTVGFEWASWTDREMSQADWIIFVCSESSYELLSYSNGTKEIEVSLPSVKKATPLDTAVNESTKKVYFSSKILYYRLFNDEKLRIIPVVLRKGDQHFILPILQDPQNVLHIYEDRPFDYDKFEGHFERLICRMANINRIALDNASAGQKTGYIKLKSKIPATRDPIQLYNQPIEQEETLQAPINSTYRQISSVASIPGTSGAQSYQASPQHYHHNTHIHVTAHPSFNAPAQSYNHPVIPPMYQPQPHFRQPQYSQYYEHSHINDQYRNHNGDTHPSVIHNNVSHQLAVHQNIPAAPKAPADDLPSHKIPVDSPILWQLSQDVREWKFIARFLDLDEEVIEEIDQYARPNKTRDKSLKMLTEWVNTSSDATWKALGEAIQDAENTLLYEKLVELIKSYAI